MHGKVVRAAAVVVVFTAVIAWWPFTLGPGSGLFVVATPLTAATAAGLATVSVVVLAWRSGDGSPVYLALGCLTVAQAFVLRYLLDNSGLGLQPSAATIALPSLGVAVAGGWFAMSVAGARPEVGRRRWLRRAVLAGGAVVTAGFLAAILSEPGVLRDGELVPLLFGCSAAASLYSAAAWYRSWWLMRLPSQLAMTAAGASLAGITVVSGAGWPAALPWQMELAAVLAVVLVAAGCVVEERRRPGLHTLGLGLVLPGVARQVERGELGPMERLLEATERDERLRGHPGRVAALAIRVGMRLRLNASHLQEVALAAQLHDVGKVAVPWRILGRPGPLLAEEYEAVKQHPLVGARILRRVSGLAVAARAVGEHHERWDGAGYPHARQANEISLTARIVAVADAYDVLVSTKGLLPAAALAEIQCGTGSQFDPAIVEEFVKVVGDAARAPGEAAA